MPDWLLWLLPVPVATGLAVVWVSWTSRTRGPGSPHSSVRAHERFGDALRKPPPGSPPA